jgi:hypothetical protein
MRMCEARLGRRGGRGPRGVALVVYTALYTDQVSSFDLSLYIHFHLTPPIPTFTHSHRVNFAL